VEIIDKFPWVFQTCSTEPLNHLAGGLEAEAVRLGNSRGIPIRWFVKDLGICKTIINHMYIYIYRESYINNIIYKGHIKP